MSALRLAEKGYRVAVLESGRRFSDHDFGERLSQVRRTIFAPKLGLKGILRITAFKDVMILSGSGVGGGSLVYAQTLWRAGPGFFDDWRTVCGEAPDLEQYYELAEGMLGVVAHPHRTPADADISAIARDLGVTQTFSPVPVGVYFGEPGVEHADPYFGGDGPARSGCIDRGLCMLGCRNNAKNTLPKNYLWFAERLGVHINPERTVTSIRPTGAQTIGRDMPVTVTAAAHGFARIVGRRPRGRWSSPPVRSEPTSCSPSARPMARCRASRTGSASWSAPTARSMTAGDRSGGQRLGTKRLDHLEHSSDPGLLRLEAVT